MNMKNAKILTTSLSYDISRSFMVLSWTVLGFMEAYKFGDWGKVAAIPTMLMGAFSYTQWCPDCSSMKGEFDALWKDYERATDKPL